MGSDELVDDHIDSHKVSMLKLNMKTRKQFFAGFHLGFRWMKLGR
jgi:hypothetical protein